MSGDWCGCREVWMHYVRIVVVGKTEVSGDDVI